MVHTVIQAQPATYCLLLCSDIYNMIFQQVFTIYTEVVKFGGEMMMKIQMLASFVNIFHLLHLPWVWRSHMWSTPNFVSTSCEHQSLGDCVWIIYYV